MEIEMVRSGGKSPSKAAKPPGMAEEAAERHADVTDRVDLQLGPGGRIVIPAAFRKAMQVEIGDRLMARVVDGELRVITPAMGVKRAQKLVRETIPGNDSLVDTLMEQRRREFEREMEDG
jgi:bifunctional DNA-binding transcriptional regulator/antitoxin component of YhaV-PrlF toxin-antitoxin module